MKDRQAHSKTPPKREYRQGVRAEAARASFDRMVSAFITRLSSAWFEDIRLDDVARDAAVSVQTVIRRFGSKEGLLEAAVAQLDVEVNARRAVRRRGVTGVLEALLEDYEISGDMVIKLLAQEARHSALHLAAETGRAGHRDWLAEQFHEDLKGFDDGERSHRLDGLVAATDVYLWKLLRRDLGRPPDVWLAIAERFVRATLTRA